MKVTIELTTEEEIKTFYERMIAPNKPNITVYAAPAPEPDPAPSLPEGFMPAPENVPFQKENAPKAAGSAPAPVVTFEMVQKKAIKLVQEQRQPELRALLEKHGLQALPDLKDSPDKLAAFYKDVEVL